MNLMLSILIAKKDRNFANVINNAWLLASDFNEPISLEERYGTGIEMQRHCDKFKFWITNNALIDLGFFGPKFPWSRDYNPLFINTKGFTTITRNEKPFRFLSAWQLHEDFDNKKIFENIFHRKWLLWAHLDGVQRQLNERGNQHLLTMKAKLQQELDD
ncbi:hypothetical protein Cgig2_014450 [Carnegiea gigantea]|uniref:Uncharacterized protein n=1 Tax=Carnegiea gigantea TaxID=171969 RepID=A0A9Q1K311_9CARY|nr:hypothetical protein Cgig2_014450 [Carnegiea gigantea]